MVTQTQCSPSHLAPMAGDWPRGARTARFGSGTRRRSRNRPPGKVFTLTGHTDEVRSVAYSADGRWLASAGDDRLSDSGTRPTAGQCTRCGDILADLGARFQPRRPPNRFG